MVNKKITSLLVPLVVSAGIISGCGKNAKPQKNFLPETDTLEYIEKEDTASHNVKKVKEKTKDTGIFLKRKQFFENAEKYIGIPYEWGGRMTERKENLDCMGLIFLAYSKTFDKNWTDISTKPSKIIKKEQLGKPVKGLDGILSENVKKDKMQKGDIVYLLSKHSINDDNITEINGKKYWPWHMGIYSGKKTNNFLHAKPSYKVTKTDFNALLNKNKGIYVTRIGN